MNQTPDQPIGSFYAPIYDLGTAETDLHAECRVEIEQLRVADKWAREIIERQDKEIERLLAEYDRLNRYATDEMERLRDLIRTAHDNADYIVSMLKSESEAVSQWPQTCHAVLLLKAEAIMALGR